MRSYTNYRNKKLEDLSDPERAMLQLDAQNELETILRRTKGQPAFRAYLAKALFDHMEAQRPTPQPEPVRYGEGPKRPAYVETLFGDE
jgi:hypothetical protein